MLWSLNFGLCIGVGVGGMLHGRRGGASVREIRVEEEEDTAWSWRIEGVSGHKTRRE